VKVRDETPEFDFDEPTSPTVTKVGRERDEFDLQETVGIPPRVGSTPAVGISTWREVPQARFLSWSPRMQAAYCRDRDLDSYEQADDEDTQQFFLRRANMYDEMSRT
jgi:hypothetical protein